MKKKYLFILLFLSVLNIFSQSWNSLTPTQRQNSSAKNELAKFFKKEIPKVLLRNIFYSKNEPYVSMSFFINEQKEPYGIKATAYRNFELRKALEKAFENYLFEKLNIAEVDTKKKYIFQVISKKGNKNIINCSNEIISKSLPANEKCNDINLYQDIETCIQEDVKKYFYENIDFSLDQEQDSDKRIVLRLNLFVDKTGKLQSKEIKAPEIFISDLKKIISNYPILTTTAKEDGLEANYPFLFSISYERGEQPKYKYWRSVEGIDFKLNASNEFSNYLTKTITPQELESANLNRINNRLTLHFEIDSRNKPFNISTNARSAKLDKKIIEAFKNYPLDKLTFKDRSPFNSYFTDILYFEDNKTIIQTFDEILHERAPVFPGCETMTSIKSVKQCFSRNIQMHFVQKFDADIAKKLGLSKGRKRIFIGFKISMDGDIENIKVRAPHPKIAEEVKRVMQTLPSVKPGAQNGENVNVKYSIPFTMIVD